MASGNRSIKVSAYLSQQSNEFWRCDYRTTTPLDTAELLPCPSPKQAFPALLSTMRLVDVTWVLQHDSAASAVHSVSGKSEIAYEKTTCLHLEGPLNVLKAFAPPDLNLDILAWLNDAHHQLEVFLRWHFVTSAANRRLYLEAIDKQ